MQTFTAIAAIGILAFTASEENSPVKNVADPLMSFESRHLSIAQCDSMNFIAGRELKWNTQDNTFSDTVAHAASAIHKHKSPKTEKQPAWISEILEKGEAYQAGRKQKMGSNKTRMSEYSPTELSIAKSMHLNPWDIDRKQLRRWGKETDMILSGK
ncbi:MAG: hypothetical protein JW863_09790 [Chitinispirillaceae bacterium]|nr:hypothetical protein [Chitinispirillaceae bacterium]